MRNISNDALTKLAIKTGIEPLLILEVQWTDTNSTKYCDKRLDGIQGLIIERSSLDDIIKVDFGGNSANISVVLDDTDGHLKELLDTVDINKRQCILYQYFSGLELSDAFEIFRGEVHSPIVWSEGQRTLSFNIISRIFHREVGFSPEEAQFEFVPEEFIANVWPLGFGSPEHVPAVELFNVARGTVLNFSGIPDYTLQLKRELVQKRMDEAVEGFNYYQILIAQARELEVSGQQLQREYANHCVAYSELRQTVADISENLEDISKQIDILSEDFDEPIGDLPRDEITDSITTLNAYRDELIAILKKLYKELDDFKFAEDQYRYRTKVLKFEINFINTLNKKSQNLIKDYNKFKTQLSIVDQFIANQETLYLNLISITNSERFQQNTPLTFEVKKLLFTGVINNGDVTVTGIQPTYNGAALTQAVRQSDAIDTFWLATNNVDLSNMYIYTSERHIAKVTQQEGSKCLIQLPKRNKQPRQRQRRVDYSNDEDTKNLFDSTLSRLLTGGEDEAEIARVAGFVPKAINPEVRKIITGGNNQFLIKLQRLFPNKGGYNLELDGSNNIVPFITVEYTGTFRKTIKFSPDSTPSTVQGLINSLAPWLNVTVTGGTTTTQSGNTFYEYYTIDIEDNEPHLFKVYGTAQREDNDNDQATDAVIEYTGNVQKKAFITIDLAGINRTDIEAEGFIRIFINGKSARINIESEANDVETFLNDALNLDPGYLTVTGDPIVQCLEDEDFEPLTLTIANDEYGSIYIEPNYYDENDNSEGFKLTYDSDDVNWVLGQPKLTVEYVGTLKRFTRQEVENIIRNGLNSTASGELFIKAKNVLNELLLTKKTTIVNGLADKDVDEAIELAYQQIQQIANSPEFRNGYYVFKDLYEIFPEGVYNTLYEQELLGFLEYVAASRQLDVEIDEGDSYEFTTINMGTILEASPVILNRWLDPVRNESNLIRRLQKIEALPNSTEPFYVDVGDTITLANSFQEKWVCNILPSTINSVYAYRTIAGIRRLTPVPSSYYSKNENENFGEYNCTTITMVRPLEEYQENWERGLYVSYTSSVGPNLVDVITWLVNKYSTLTIDSTSFNQVSGYLENYPVDFALFQRYDLIDLLSRIAWQSRCSIWVNGNKVFLRYLPTEPDSITTITTADVEQNSLNLTFTETDDLITKYTASWKPNYAVNGNYKIVVRRNLTKFNEISDEQEYFIYKHRFLVYKSLTFWLIRRANAWRKVSFNLFLNKLMIETNDCITLNIGTHITNNPVKALVETAVYDPNSNTINVTCWLPVLANSKDYYVFSWPKDLTEQDIFPTLQDIVSGNAGNPINFSVPIETDYTAIDNAVLDNRPDDFGTTKIYDSANDLPSLVTNLEELDYKFKDSEALLLEIDNDATEQDEVVLDAPTNNNKPKEDSILIGRILNKVDVNIDTQTKSGEDVVNGNSEIDIDLKRYEVLLTDGRIVRATPFDQNIDDTTVVVNTRVFLIKDQFNSYSFWLPSHLGSSQGIIS